MSGHVEEASGKTPREGRFTFISVFVFLLAAGLVGWAFYSNQQKVEQEFQLEKMPPGMPRIAPFPKRVVTVGNVSVDEYTYAIKGPGSDNEERKGLKYTVEGTSGLSPTGVRDFYNKFFLDKGFRQRTSISMPDGHYLELENEKNLVSVEVEKKKDAKFTRVKIIVYD